MSSIISRPFSSFPVSVSADSGNTHDVIIRIQGNNTKSVAVIKPTALVVGAIQGAIDAMIQPANAACRTLGMVIDRMKLREMYANHYRDFLLGQVSEEDFEKIAEQFAYTPTCVSADELAEHLKALLTYTTEEFTTNEVAELFQVEEEFVTAAQQQLQHQLSLFSGTDLQTS